MLCLTEKIGTYQTYVVVSGIAHNGTCNTKTIDERPAAIRASSLALKLKINWRFSMQTTGELMVKSIR